MLLENVLKKEQLAKFSKEDLISVNEAVNKAINAEITNFETKLKSKFESMTAGLSDRFDTHVSAAITESVNTNIAEKLNNKMVDILKGITSLIESSGIAITDKTIELQKKLGEVNSELISNNQERDQIVKQLNDEKKNGFIYQKLAGMKPEIIAAALEQFKDRDILEVEDEIEDFLSGDLSNITPSSDTDFGDFDSPDLDKVRDALDDIDMSSSKKENRRQFFQFENADYAKLSKGLAPLKVRGTSNSISNSELEKSESAIVEAMGDTETSNMFVDSDAQDTLDKISDLNSLGFGINFGKDRSRG